LIRNRVPIVVDRVTTVTAPGESIDVLITEHGIAINPRRQDLMDRLKHSGLPLKTMQELHDIALALTGKPEEPNFSNQIVALIEWRDGTIIDTVRQLIPKV
jgi:citrate lyase subunit alpha / citrate CoA-transferase